MWADGGAADIETIEGFWIARAWTSSERCPASGDPAIATSAGPVTLPGETLALGQVFFGGSARAGRRDGKAYQITVRVPAAELALSDGLRLRISGRLARVRGRGPVECRQPPNPDQRPICFVSVVMDEVAVENPSRNETLATWGLGGGSPEI